MVHGGVASPKGHVNGHVSTDSPSSILSDTHRRMLESGSGIDRAVIAERGYRTSTGYSELKSLCIAVPRDTDTLGLLLPIYGVNGEPARFFDIRADRRVDLTLYRPDAPSINADGSSRKYLFPKGAQMRLDCPPRCQPLLGDPAVPLWITEGTKKVDTLASRGACAIALLGVWNFRGKNDKGGTTALADWQHVALDSREVRIVFDSDVIEKEQVQKALDALTGFLAAKGARVHVAYLPSENGSKVGVDDFLLTHTLQDLERLLVAPGRKNRPSAQRKAVEPEDYPYSDAYNAHALVQVHGQDLRHCGAWKGWLVWIGTHWQRDATETAMRLQRQIVMSLGAQLPSLDDDKAKALMAHIKSSLSTSRLKAAVEQAKSWEGVSIEPEKLDTDAWLLNCANGTLDLRTGALRPHRRDDLLTKYLDLPYDPHATCPLWEQFLWRAMGGSQGTDNPDMSVGELAYRQGADTQARAMIDFLRRAIGYSLTGSTREQCIFILHGPTKTGKSTFLATLRALLGPYGQQADMDSFMHKERSEVRNDLADLAGSRLVCALESQEGKRLSENLVKQMTGGADEIKARFLFQEHFTFKPQFKIFPGTNHKPVIKDTDSAIWERIRLIPFVMQIPKEERDKALDERLKAELSGILAWAVRGCLEWQQMGELGEPAAVVEATAGYRNEMDDVGRFLSEVCLLGEDHYKTQASALLKAYHRWCGQSTITGKAFAQQLSDRGYVSKRSGSGIFWQGIGLPSDTLDD